MQDKGLTRNTIDKFYTKKEVANVCIGLFEDFVNPDTKDIIIEPSAGSGAFSNELIKKYKSIEKKDIITDLKNIEFIFFIFPLDTVSNIKSDLEIIETAMRI